MNVRHAYMFEHKHTHTSQRVQLLLKVFGLLLSLHPSSVFWHTQIPLLLHPPPPSLASVSVRVGSEESVCRAACPAASWKAVDFEVFRQVIAAGKLLLADDALVWLHSGVGAAVSGQLVGP